ncbi:MAG: transposase [Bacteroidetes bacterium]|nr:MAG: transposase [Bacteroidota bacterium]
MANSNIDINIQLVFAVKNRDSLIRKDWQIQLYQYITGIVQQNNHKMLRINGMSDHIHIFIGYNVNQLIPNLVEEIKTSSNKYIKDNKLTPFKFSWQTGYGAFSYSHSDRDKVINYIINQQEHHRRKSFEEEYMGFLREFEIEFKAPYLFDFIDLPPVEI